MINGGITFAATGQQVESFSGSVVLLTSKKKHADLFFKLFKLLITFGHTIF